MFEKEAEEYKDNTRIKDKNTYIGFPNERISELQDFEGNYIDISEIIIKTFKDGAELGYNQCKDKLDIAIEIIEQMKDLFFDCWQERGLNAIKFEQQVNDFLKENE